MSAPLPTTTDEQRAPFWDDVDDLLSRGVLTASIQIGDSTVCVRTPMASELWLLQAQHPFASTWFEYVDPLLARCIWSVDRHVMIGDQEAIHVLEDWIPHLHQYVKDTLVYVLLALMARARRAERDVYYYCYEASSRLAWRSLRPSSSASQAHGLGFENLGSSMVQRVWQAYNIAEDQRIDEMVQWSMTKNIMSCHAPKGVEKMENRDKQNLESRRNDQQKLLDMFYYRAIGLLDEDGNQREEDQKELHGFKMAHTPEELADEMHRWVTGQQDTHDRVITEYKEGIRQRMVQERVERDKKLAQIRHEAEIAAKTFGYDPNRPAVVGYSLEQVQKMLRDRGGNVPDGLRNIGYSPSRRERAFDKWVDGEIDSGNLEAVDGSLVEKTGVGGDQAQTLQQKIMSRRPIIDDGGD